MRRETETVIIGAGLTGLVTGYYLSKANKNFIILEKDNRVGGVIETSSKKGFLYEKGPNTGVLGTNEAVDLFDDLNGLCTAEIANDRAKIRYVLKNGEWHALPSGPLSGLKTPLFTGKDKFRLLGEPFRKRGTNPHESLAGLVKRRMGQSFLDYAVDPFILGVYAGDPDYLVPKYALPKLYNLEQEHGSFIGGAVKRKRNKELQKQNRATREVFSVKGGLDQLTQALTNHINSGNILLNTQDIHVIPEENNYHLHYHVNGKHQEIIAKNVITTTGATALPELLPFLDERQRNSIHKLPYAKVVEIAIGFHEWKGFEPAGFGGLIPFKENRDMLGILFMSTLFENRAPEGSVLFTVFMGGYRKPHIFELSNNEILNILEKEFKEVMQVKTFDPDLLEIHRYEHAIPQYGADMGERLIHIQNIEKEYPGLLIGGNVKDGIGMADRIKQGKWLAEQAINNL